MKRLLKSLFISNLIIGLMIFGIPIASALELVRQKAVTCTVEFPITNTTGTFLTGATGLDAEYSGWNATAVPSAFTNLAMNTPVELATTGIYFCNLTATENNFDFVGVQVKSSTSGAITQFLLLRNFVGNPNNFATTSAGAAVWSDTTRTLSAGTNIALAKGTGVTGFNDVSTSDVATAAQTGLTSQGYTTTRAPYLDKLNSLTFTVANQADVNVIDWKSATAPAMTGDAYARLGAPAGASVSADIAAIKTDTGNIYTDTHTTILGRLIGTIASGTHNPQSGDAYTIVNNGTYGNSALNIAIGTRMATFTLPTNFSSLSISAGGLVDLLQTAADKVWGTTARALTDKANFTLSAAGIDSIYDEVTTGHNTASSFGLLFITDLDALISSRMATFTLPSNFEHLAITDTTGLVSVGTNNDKTGYSLSSAQTFNMTGNVSGSVGSLTGYVAPDNTGISNIKTQTDKLTFDGSNNILANVTVGGGSGATAQQVWDYNISGYSDSGKAGTYLKSAGGAADPWLTNLPGAYSSGTAGYIIGHNIDATISSRSTLTDALVWAYATRALTDKAGFSLTQAFPSNFSSLAITGAGAVTAGTVSDKIGYSISGTKTNLDALNDIPATSVWSAATRTLTAGTNIALAKGTGVTGFNDVTATDVWAAATRTLSAFGFNVTVGTNNDKTGYSLSSVGVQAIWDTLTSALNALNSIGKLLVDNINAAITSRMATFTYTAPNNTDISNIVNQTSKMMFDDSNKIIANATASVSQSDISNIANATANATWEVNQTQHNNPGTTGKKLGEMPTPYDIGP